MAETQNIVPQDPWSNANLGQVQPYSPWVGVPSQNGGPDPDQIQSGGGMPQDAAIQTYANLQNKLQGYGKQAQAMAAQNALANISYQKSINDKAMPVDLTPLMSLTDAWTGSHFAQSYKPPETPQQRMDMLQKLQGELDKNSTNMSEQQVQLLKAQLETQMRKEERELQLQSVQAQRDVATAIRGQSRDDKLTEEGRKHLETAIKGWQSDTVATDANKKIEEVGHAKELLDDALINPAAASQVPITFARLAVPSRINETEIRAFGGSKKLSDQLDQIYENAAKGTLTQANHDYLLSVAEAAERSAQSTKSERAVLHAKQYSRVSGKSPESALLDLTGGTVDPSVLTPKPKTNAASAKVWSAGDVFTDPDTGTKYKFSGGDSTDSRNWQEQ